jgi:hypothetical protein
MKRVHPLLPVIATVVLLAGVGAASLAKPDPADADPFHAQVRQAVDAAPLRFGEWTGRDVPLPEAAIDLLRPNALLSRQFTSSQTGESFQWLVVQCRDARDLGGHYPPRCYPANGYSPVSDRPTRWQIAGLELPGTAYRFSHGPVLDESYLDVLHFMVLADGSVVRDMDAVRHAGGDYVTRHYGAAQVQLVTDGTVPAERQRQMLADVVAAHQPIFEAMSRSPIGADGR